MEENHYMCYGKVALASGSPKWENYWIIVNGFWMEITKRVGDPSNFLLPLDISSFSAGFIDTGIQNSIFIITSSATNSVKLYIQTLNRNDIIQLHHSIKKGEEILTNKISQSTKQLSCDFDCETIAAFLGIGKTSLKFLEDSNGIKLISNKNTQYFKFDTIKSVYSKANYGTDTRLCIGIDEDGETVTKELNCFNKNNLMKAIFCFLVNSFLWNKEIRNEDL